MAQTNPRIQQLHKKYVFDCSLFQTAQQQNLPLKNLMKRCVQRHFKRMQQSNYSISPFDIKQIIFPDLVFFQHKL